VREVKSQPLVVISGVISGVMPPRARFTHTFGFLVMCLLFAGLLAYDADVLLQGGRVPTKGVAGSAAAILTVAVLGIGIQLWFRRRIITEFAYDENALRFRTLGIAEMQIRHVSEISDFSEWRGRGGILGYRLHFRDGARVYLQFSVTNSKAVLEEIVEKLRRGPEASPK
jgi:hypothetical protein